MLDLSCFEYILVTMRILLRVCPGEWMRGSVTIECVTRHAYIHRCMYIFYMYVCMYVCMHICMYECIYIYMYVCRYVCM